MTFLKKLFGGKSGDPPKRTRVCVECGMPIAEHKDWCSILKGENEIKLKRSQLSANQT
jgi:hypothetical protein